MRVSAYMCGNDRGSVEFNAEIISTTAEYLRVSIVSANTCTIVYLPPNSERTCLAT